MDDVSLLLSALASGAAYNDAEGIGHGGSERGGQVVAVAYNALREAVAERLAGDRAGEVALAEHAADPETWRIPLAKALRSSGVSSDTGVLTTARLVLTLAEAAGVGEEARRIDIRDAQGVQVGDQNRQYNNVGTVVEAEYAQTVTAYSGTAVGVQGGSAYVGARRTDGSAGPVPLEY